MRSWRHALPLIAWMGALLVGLAAFHGLGRGPMAAPPVTDPGAWGDWAAARDPLVAAVAVLRLVVLALAWYLVGVTTVGLVARLLRAARLVRVADALTVPMVRHLLQSALGVGLATAMVGAATVPASSTAPRVATDHATMEAPAEPGAGHVSLVRYAADDAEVTMAPAVDDAEVTMARTEPTEDAGGAPVSMRLLEEAGTDPPAGEVTMRPSGRDEPGEATLRAVEQGPGTDAHRVAAGESLWSIAQDALADRWDREPTEGEVLDYWERVIERNRDALPDPDNPDLLFPGDEVELPSTGPEA